MMQDPQGRPQPQGPAPTTAPKQKLTARQLADLAELEREMQASRDAPLQRGASDPQGLLRQSMGMTRANGAATEALMQEIDQALAPRVALGPLPLSVPGLPPLAGTAPALGPDSPPAEERMVGSLGHPGIDAHELPLAPPSDPAEFEQLLMAMKQRLQQRVQYEDAAVEADLQRGIDEAPAQAEQLQQEMRLEPVQGRDYGAEVEKLKPYLPKSRHQQLSDTHKRLTQAPKAVADFEQELETKLRQSHWDKVQPVGGEAPVRARLTDLSKQIASLQGKHLKNLRPTDPETWPKDDADRYRTLKQEFDRGVASIDSPGVGMGDVTRGLKSIVTNENTVGDEMMNIGRSLMASRMERYETGKPAGALPLGASDTSLPEGSYYGPAAKEALPPGWTPETMRAALSDATARTVHKLKRDTTTADLAGQAIGTAPWVALGFGEAALGLKAAEAATKIVPWLGRASTGARAAKATIAFAATPAAVEGTFSALKPLPPEMQNRLDSIEDKGQRDTKERAYRFTEATRDAALAALFNVGIIGDLTRPGVREVAESAGRKAAAAIKTGATVATMPAADEATQEVVQNLAAQWSDDDGEMSDVLKDITLSGEQGGPVRAFYKAAKSGDRTAMFEAAKEYGKAMVPGAAGVATAHVMAATGTLFPRRKDLLALKRDIEKDLAQLPPEEAEVVREQLFPGLDGAAPTKAEDERIGNTETVKAALGEATDPTMVAERLADEVMPDLKGTIDDRREAVTAAGDDPAMAPYREAMEGIERVRSAPDKATAEIEAERVRRAFEDATERLAAADEQPERATPDADDQADDGFRSAYTSLKRNAAAIEKRLGAETAARVAAAVGSDTSTPANRQRVVDLHAEVTQAMSAAKQQRRQKSVGQSAEDAMVAKSIERSENPAADDPVLRRVAADVQTEWKVIGRDTEAGTVRLIGSANPDRGITVRESDLGRYKVAAPEVESGSSAPAPERAVVDDLHEIAKAAVARGVTSVRAMAATLGVSRHRAAKVMQQLVDAGAVLPPTKPGGAFRVNEQAPKTEVVAEAEVQTAALREVRAELDNDFEAAAIALDASGEIPDAEALGRKIVAGIAHHGEIARPDNPAAGKAAVLADLMHQTGLRPEQLESLKLPKKLVAEAAEQVAQREKAVDATAKAAAPDQQPTSPLRTDPVAATKAPTLNALPDAVRESFEAAVKAGAHEVIAAHAAWHEWVTLRGGDDPEHKNFVYRHRALVDGINRALVRGNKTERARALADWSELVRQFDQADDFVGLLSMTESGRNVVRHILDLRQQIANGEVVHGNKRRKIGAEAPKKLAPKFARDVREVGGEPDVHERPYDLIEKGPPGKRIGVGAVLGSFYEAGQAALSKALRFMAKHVGGMADVDIPEPNGKKHVLSQRGTDAPEQTWVAFDEMLAEATERRAAAGLGPAEDVAKRAMTVALKEAGMSDVDIAEALLQEPGRGEFAGVFGGDGLLDPPTMFAVAKALFESGAVSAKKFEGFMAAMFSEAARGLDYAGYDPKQGFAYRDSESGESGKVNLGLAATVAGVGAAAVLMPPTVTAGVALLATAWHSGKVFRGAMRALQATTLPGKAIGELLTRAGMLGTAADRVRARADAARGRLFKKHGPSYLRHTLVDRMSLYDEPGMVMALERGGQLTRLAERLQNVAHKWGKEDSTFDHTAKEWLRLHGTPEDKRTIEGADRLAEIERALSPEQKDLLSGAEDLLTHLREMAANELLPSQVMRNRHLRMLGLVLGEQGKHADAARKAVAAAVAERNKHAKGTDEHKAAAAAAAREQAHARAVEKRLQRTQDRMNKIATEKAEEAKKWGVREEGYAPDVPDRDPSAAVLEAMSRDLLNIDDLHSVMSAANGKSPQELLEQLSVQARRMVWNQMPVLERAKHWLKNNNVLQRATEDRANPEAAWERHKAAQEKEGFYVDEGDKDAFMAKLETAPGADPSFLRSMFHYTREVFRTMNAVHWMEQNHERMFGTPRVVTSQEINRGKLTSGTDLELWAMDDSATSRAPTRYRMGGSVYRVDLVDAKGKGRTIYTRTIEAAKQVKGLLEIEGDAASLGLEPDRGWKLAQEHFPKQIVLLPSEESAVQPGVNARVAEADLPRIPGQEDEGPLVRAYVPAENAKLFYESQLAGKLFTREGGKIEEILKGKGGIRGVHRYLEYVREGMRAMTTGIPKSMPEKLADGIASTFRHLTLGIANPVSAVKEWMDSTIANMFWLGSHRAFEGAALASLFDERMRKAEADLAKRPGDVFREAKLVKRDDNTLGSTQETLLRHMRTPDDELAKMSPEERAKQELVDEALLAMAQSPITAESTTAQWSDVGSRTFEYGKPMHLKLRVPENVQEAKDLVGDVTRLGSQAADKLSWSLRHRAQQHGLRQTFLATYLTLRRDGETPAAARHQTEMYLMANGNVGNRLSNSQVWQNWAGRIVRLLAGYNSSVSTSNWAYLTRGGVGAEGLGRKAMLTTKQLGSRLLGFYLRAYVLQQAWQLLPTDDALPEGIDIARSLGTGTSEVPGVGPMLTWSTKQLEHALHLGADPADPTQALPPWKASAKEWARQNLPGLAGEWAGRVIANAGSWQSAAPLPTLYGLWSPMALDQGKQMLEWWHAKQVGDDQKADRIWRKTTVGKLWFVRGLDKILEGRPDPVDPDSYLTRDPITGISQDRIRRDRANAAAGMVRWMLSGFDADTTAKIVERSVIAPQREERMKVASTNIARAQQKLFMDVQDTKLLAERETNKEAKARLLATLPAKEAAALDSIKQWGKDQEADLGEMQARYRSQSRAAVANRSLTSDERDIVHAYNTETGLRLLSKAMREGMPKARFENLTFGVWFQGPDEFRKALGRVPKAVREDFLDAYDKSRKAWAAPQQVGR